jgi:acetyl esterase
MINYNEIAGLDPHAAQVLTLIQMANRPPYETGTAPEARAAYREARAAVSPDPPDVDLVRDLAAPGPGGPLTLRLYRGAGTGAAALPVLMFFHGGGWVIGDIDTHDVVCRRLANAAGCAVVSVDYRLAPEAKFPAAIEDCIAATNWVAAEAATLGLDGQRMAVGGDSAGGNLAAVVALHARDHGGPALRMQLLIYPATEFAMTHPSHERCGEGFLLTHPTMVWFRGAYLRSEADMADPRASPLRTPDLSRLPPAYLITAGFDPLCDEGREYGERLTAAGVPVEHLFLSGQIHGFMTLGKLIPAAGEAATAAGTALKAAFA